MYYFSVYILKTNQRTLLCLKKTPPLSGKASAKIKTQKEINKKRDTILNFFKALTDNTELFRLLFINKDNKELQGDIVEYIKGKLNERKEKC